MQSIVTMVTEKSSGRKITRIILEIGVLSAVMPDAIRFCFDVVVQGSALEGATLDIIEIAARARCSDCGAEVTLATVVHRCSCGSQRLQMLSGNELNIKSFEIEEV